MKTNFNKKVNCLRLEFNDLEQLNHAANKWNLNFRQLEPGQVSGEMMILDSPALQLGTVSINRHIEQRGFTPEGYRTFAIPADQNQFFNWRDQQITGNSLMLFPGTGEIDAVSFPGFEVFTISLSEKLIRELMIKHPQDSINITKDAEVLELGLSNMNILRKSLAYLFKKAKHNPQIVKKAAFRRLLFQNIPSTLINSLHSPVSKRKTSKNRVRDISLKKAVYYIESCIADFPSVDELCLIAGASQRTLEYAFKEKYGITPHTYIKNLRLNRVKKTLQFSDPKITSIIKVAEQHGFWHMGQFAADYKKLYRELPSFTLKKNG